MLTKTQRNKWLAVIDKTLAEEPNPKVTCYFCTAVKTNCLDCIITLVGGAGCFGWKYAVGRVPRDGSPHFLEPKYSGLRITALGLLRAVVEAGDV